MRNSGETEPHMPIPGSLVGGWQLLECVGEGAYGVGYRCVRESEPEGRPYALKWAKTAGDERFEREAELLSRIAHENVPRLYGRGEWVGPGGRRHPYVVMEWAEGKPLYAWARSGSVTLGEKCRVLAQVARALEATHEHGLHRDVKGDNVLVSPEGQVKLLDYGTCWYEGASPLTDTVIPPGTEPYRSPQLLRFRYQFRGDVEAHYEYHRADDVYALGAMAYRLLTGLYPPPGTDPEGKPPALRPPSELVEVDAELEGLVLKMLSHERAARGTAGELARGLERVAMRLPVRSCPAPKPHSDWLMRGLFAAGGLALAGAWSLAHSEAPRPEPPPWRADETPEESEEVTGMADGGVSDAVLASAAIESRHHVSPLWIGAAPPKKPFPGQSRPPCNARHIEIHGLCWWVVSSMTPPCDADAFDWGNRCVAPAFPSSPGPTSEPP